MKKYLKLIVIIFSLFIFNIGAKAYELESEISCEYTSDVGNGYVIHGYKYNITGAGAINYWYKRVESCDPSLPFNTTKTENITSIEFPYPLTIFNKQTKGCTGQTINVYFTFDNILYDAYEQYLKYYNENEEYYQKNGKYKYNYFKASQFCPLTSVVGTGESYKILYSDRGFTPTENTGSSSKPISEYTFNVGTVDGYNLSIIFTKENNSYSVVSKIKKGTGENILNYSSNKKSVRLNDSSKVVLPVSTVGLAANTTYTIVIQSDNLNKMLNSIENGTYKSLNMTSCVHLETNASTYYVVSSTEDAMCNGGIDTEYEHHEDPPEYNSGNEANLGGVDIPPQQIEEINFCERSGVLKAFQIVGYVLFVIKILVPLILIGMGTYDFAKAAVSSDDKANKTALSSLVRRIIIGVVIFFIPTVINLVINMIDSSINSDLGEGSKFSNCSSCLLDPIDGCDGASLEQTVQKPSGGGQSGGTFGGRK